MCVSEKVSRLDSDFSRFNRYLKYVMSLLHTLREKYPLSKDMEVILQLQSCRLPVLIHYLDIFSEIERYVYLFCPLSGNILFGLRGCCISSFISEKKINDRLKHISLFRLLYLSTSKV